MLVSTSGEVNWTPKPALFGYIGPDRLFSCWIVAQTMELAFVNEDW